MASSCQDEQSPLPHDTSSQVWVNREESLTRQSQDRSRSEADKPPREFPEVLLVLVPHVLERVRLPRAAPLQPRNLHRRPSWARSCCERSFEGRTSLSKETRRRATAGSSAGIHHSCTGLESCERPAFLAAVLPVGGSL